MYKRQTLYLTPTKTAQPSIYDPLAESQPIVLDAINIGRMGMSKKPDAEIQLGLAAPMRERGSVQVEEYREDGLYLEGIVKTEDLHCFEAVSYTHLDVYKRQQ